MKKNTILVKFYFRIVLNIMSRIVKAVKIPVSSFYPTLKTSVQKL